MAYLIISSIALIVLLIFIGYLIKNNCKFKKEIKELKSYSIFKKILEVSSGEKNIIKSLIQMNSVLLNEIDLDFSTFFLYDKKFDILKLQETNIADKDFARLLVDIRKFRGNSESDYDFLKTFDENIPIWIESDNPMNSLIYPTAKERGIKTAYFAPLLANGQILGYWLVEDEHSNASERYDAEQLILIGDLIAQLLQNGLYMYMDPKKQIPKFDFFKEFVTECIEKEEKICLVYSDIDNFKAFNTKYGHEGGDIVLAHVANLYKNSVRPIDMVANFGGDEILFAFIGCTIEECAKRVEDIRRKLEKNVVNINSKSTNVTGTYGISEYPEDGKTVDELLHEADRRLYIAKDQGKNCIVYKG